MAQPRKLHDRFFKQAKAEGYLARSAYKLKEIDDRKKILRRGDLVLDLGCAPGSWLQVVLERVGPQGAAVGIDLQKVEHVAASNLRTAVADIYKVSGVDLLGLAQDPSPEPGGGLPRGARPQITSESPKLGAGAEGVRDRDRLGWSVEESGQALGGEDAEPAEAPVRVRRYDVVLSDMAPNTSGHDDDLLSARLCRRVLEIAVQVLRPGGSLVMKVLEGAEFPQLLKDTQKLFGEARAFKPQATREVSREIYIVAKTFRAAGGTPK